jgi:hypothetical protein
MDRIANAFAELAAKPSLGLMHRYQTRLHLNYQRALHNMLLLRAAAVPNKPSPISGHLRLDDRPASPTTILPAAIPPATLGERFPRCLPIPGDPPTPDASAGNSPQPNVSDS